jgi:SAM-dependent methyltransferase
LDYDTCGISCAFDEQSEKMLKDYRKDGLADTSLTIADAVAGQGFSGSSVLEVGCGFGGLTLELLKRGASKAVGVDLSPKMIELARKLTADAGLTDRATFELGDGAAARLPRSDVVILDAVLCCYPNVDTLVENSSSAAATKYALALPDDRRLATRLLSLVLPIQAVVFRGKRKGFRFFIHPTRKIVGLLEQKGFRLLSRSPQGWIWSVLVFARTGEA